MPVPRSLLPCAVVILCACCSQSQADQPVVSSKAGTFQGSVLTAPNGQQFTAFTGVPFAQPPLRKLRFAKPQPLGPLQGVYDATKPAPSCIQARTPTKQDTLGQEDCLYLNVYTPVDSLRQVEEGQKKKVFVYIHGGAWHIGASADWVPGDLVTQGDIIVVTANYRLWWLGFLQGRTNQLPGNQGLWDHVMALRWVKDNIGAFGGDADDVTLGGESSGAFSTSLLMVSGVAKDLFSKSILCSGSIFNTQQMKGHDVAMLEELATRLGYNKEVDKVSLIDADEDETSKVIDYLRALPEDSFKIPVEFPVSRFRVDGELFPASIPKLVKDDSYLSKLDFGKKPTLVTLTNNEGPILYWGVWGPTPPIPYDDFSVYDVFAQRTGIPAEVFYKLVGAYKTTEDLDSEPVLDILAGLVFELASFKTLDTHAKFGGENTYLLRFEHHPSYNPHPQKGVFHAVDLTYLFDKDPRSVMEMYYGLEDVGEFAEEDWAMKRSYITKISDFVKTGNPGHSMEEAWPPYDPATQAFLRFGPQPRADTKVLQHRRRILTELFPRWIGEFMAKASSAPKSEL